MQVSRSKTQASGASRRLSGSGYGRLNTNGRAGVGAGSGAEDRGQANGREGVGAGSGAEVRGPGEGVGAGSGHTKADSTSNGPASIASTKSASRRRALIQHYSEDEEDNTAPPPSQQVPFKAQISPYQDVDIDMQLEDVSPEHGGSSLQISTSHDEYLAAPNQDATKLDRLDTINLADATPPISKHKSPRKEVVNDTQSAKRRRSEGEGHTRNSESSHPQHLRTKEAIPSIDIVSHMSLGFAIHEDIAAQKGTEIIHEHRTYDEFTNIGTPSSEVIEFQTLRRAFPRVPQVCFPNERPDAVPGHHLNFTQIPRQERVDPTTGLSEGFHVTFRFDYGFKSMNRQEVRGACLERLRIMDVPLGTAYSNPIDVGLNAVTKQWAGFVKVHLQKPHLHGIALLKGHRAFVMEMENGEKVIGKVEKEFELATKARNLRLHLKGESLRHENAFTIFPTLVQESYYSGLQHEFMGLTKPEVDKNFSFLTLTTEEARDLVLKQGLIYKKEKLQVSITRDRGVGNLSDLRISLTLVANNLPQRETRSAITMAIKQAFGPDNVVDITFGTTTQRPTTKQAGWCHIQCLNAAVYTAWIHKFTLILGRRIDFVPHRGSIDGSEPNKTAIRLAQAPVREVIADKIQAMGNAANPNPLITEKYLSKTIREFEEKLDEKFGSLTTTINSHTDRRHETTTTTITNHTTNLHALLGTMAQEFQQSNVRMQNIIHGLSTAAPEIIHRTALPLPLQAPPGFPSNPQAYHQGPHTLNE